MKLMISIGAVLLIMGLALPQGYSKMSADARTTMLAGADGHHAAGKVTITKDKNGNAVLVITDSKIDRVPDGRAHLAKDGDYTKGVELGKLKAFSGTMEFIIPAGVNPELYNSLVIWCHKFNVKIGEGFFEKELRP